MMYILTKTELENLVPKEKYDKCLNDIEKLNELVLKTAKFKCIHSRTREDEDKYGDEFYCDNCPLGTFPTTCNKRRSFSQ